MISSFRNLSKSKVGMVIIAAIGVLIVFSFAMGDITNLGGTAGGSTSALASVGDEEVTDREMSDALEQQLAQVRQQNPEADYTALDGSFNALLESLISEHTLKAFADDNGFVLSKRLVDAEIARLPGVTGADGKFSDAAYRGFLAQRRLTDAQIRQAFGTTLYQRLLLVPVTAEVRVPSGIARPYASMLLEQREAEVVLVPAAPFRDGIEPTDKDIESFYRAQAARYTVPEQRVLRYAPITADNITVPAPTEKEIAASLKARAAEFASRDIRVLSQVVLADEATAALVADAARDGSFVAAVEPQGFSAADVSVGPQTREQFASLATEAIADAVFADDVASGTIVGPIRSSFGWHVVRVESISSEGGVSPSEARQTVLADLTAAARDAAFVDVVTKVEDQIDDGASFEEAAKAAGLTIAETPLVTAGGRNLDDPAYQFPADYRAILANGFQMFADDDPEVTTLPDGRGYALVAIGDIVESAPAPLAKIKPQVRNDFINRQALSAARRVANAIQRAMAGGKATAAAIAEAEAAEGVDLPEIRNLGMRRLDLSQFQGDTPAPVQMMFNLAKGQSRVTGGATNEGIYVVKTTNIIPGDATSNPGLVSRTAQGFQQVVGNELAEQFLRAMREDVGVSRNEKAIAATRARITGGGTQ